VNRIGNRIAPARFLVFVILLALGIAAGTYVLDGLALGVLLKEQARGRLTVAFVQPPTWCATPAESIAIISSVKAIGGCSSSSLNEILIIR